MQSENNRVEENNVVEQIEAAIKNTIDKCATKLNDNEKAELEQVFHKIVFRGMVPKDAMNLNDNLLNICYNHAYNLYNTGKYEDALKLFTIMTLFDPQSAQYMFGVAASYHKIKEYKKAIEAYFTCAMQDRTTPLPYYHISDCFLELDNPEGASLALNAAVQRCSNEPDFAKLKAKCYAMIAGLKKTAQIAEEG